MRKVIKIFLHTISTLLLLMLFIPTFVGLALLVPMIQEQVVRMAGEYVSRKLETTVKIDKILLKPFTQLEVRGFYVEDFDGDTLLYVGVADAALNSRTLLRGELSFDELKADEIRMYMKQYADGTNNVKLLVEKFAKENPDSKFELRCPHIRAANSVFRLWKEAKRGFEYGIDFDDFALNDIDLIAENFHIVKDSLSFEVEDLSLRENSGIKVSEAVCGFATIHSRGMRFEEVQMKIDNSYLESPYAQMEYGHWEELSDFEENVTLGVKIRNSMVTFQTLSYFAPKLRDWNLKLSELDGTVNGKVKSMSGELRKVKVNDRTLARLDYSIKGLPDVDNTVYNINVGEFRSNVKEIDLLVADITGKPFSPEVMDRVRWFGDVRMQGYFSGTLKEFFARAEVDTEQGLVATNIDIRPETQSGRTAFSGSASVEELNVGRVMGVDKLGKVSISAFLDGEFGGDDLQANIDAHVSQLLYNRYQYHDIDFSGKVKNRMFNGEIESSDPNLDFSFDGVMDFNDSIPSYNFAMKLRNADLAKLNFNKRDSLSTVQCFVAAEGSGTTLDNLNGRVSVDSLLYVNHLDSVRTGAVEFYGENSERSKKLSMSSAFADVEFRSRMSYSKMFSYIRDAIYDYIPVLKRDVQEREMIGQRTDPAEGKAGAGGVVSAEPDQAEGERRSVQRAGNALDYSLLSLNVKEANNVAGALMPGLIVAKGTKLALVFNPEADKFALSFNTEYIEHENMFFSNIDVNSRNMADSISIFLRADEVYVSGYMIPNFSIVGGVRNNQMTLSARFSDADRDVKAQVNVDARFERNMTKKSPILNIKLSDSHVTSKQRRWDVSTDGVLLESGRIGVSNFSVRGDNQSLLVDGVASRSKADTLHVALNNFDIYPVNQFTESLGYTIKGYSSGRAALASALGDGMMYAKISLDSVNVNQRPVPDVNFESVWDFQRERARFSLIEEQSADTLVVGYYRPADRRYVGRANLKGVDLSLLDPLLKGSIRDTKGVADASVSVVGQRNQVKVNGEIRVPKFNTTVDFLNTDYSVRDAVVEVKDNVLILRKTAATDSEGNNAELELDVNMNSLNNVSFNLGVRATNCVVLNTTPKHNELFFGKVYASGTTSIRGDRRGVNMDITATTGENSSFFMPLTDKLDMSEVDYITFTTPQKQNVVDSSDYAIRKRIIMERFERSKAAVEEANVNINMTLNVLPNTLFELMIDPSTGHTMRGRGNGTLTLHVNPRNEEFTMYGDYQITEGTYLFTLENLISKPFVIAPGSKIVWTGDPIDAELDITAIYNLKTSIGAAMNSAIGGTDAMSNAYSRVRVPIECRIILAERLSQPEIMFNVTAPNATPETQHYLSNFMSTQEMMATQFFFLLATGNFYDMATNIGATADSNTAIDILLNQLSNWASSDKLDIGFRYARDNNSDYSELGIDLSRSLLGDRLLIELEGSYYTGIDDIQVHSKNMKNFMGDFYLTGLIDKSGNLKAKVFSRTIDRFDENQGLQEAGLGVYYKEDFNTFRDVVRNLRDRFSGDRRRRKAKLQQEQDDYENTVEPKRNGRKDKPKSDKTMRRNEAGLSPEEHDKAQTVAD